MNQDDNRFPHLTVAAIVHREQRFLIVEELESGRAVFNQPAGHVECGETLQAAIVRETLEETGWEIDLEALLGSTSYFSPANSVHYYRTTFIASAAVQRYSTPPDASIRAVHWFTVDQLRAESDKMRSPLVLRTIERYLQGVRYPLDYLY